MYRTEVGGKPKRLSRGRLIGVAAMVLLLVGACQSRDEAPVTTAAPENPAATPAGAATSFIEAYGAFDAERAISYLADDADISGMIGAVGAAPVAEGTLKEFRLLISHLEGIGYKQMLDPCGEEGSSASGTLLRCTFRFPPPQIRRDRPGSLQRQLLPSHSL